MDRQWTFSGRRCSPLFRRGRWTCLRKILLSEWKVEIRVEEQTKLPRTTFICIRLIRFSHSQSDHALALRERSEPQLHPDRRPSTLDQIKITCTYDVLEHMLRADGSVEDGSQNAPKGILGGPEHSYFVAAQMGFVLGGWVGRGDLIEVARVRLAGA